MAQRLAYCVFASPTQASFASPASASHFSTATLYSASRLSAPRPCGRPACVVAASGACRSRRGRPWRRPCPSPSAAFASLTQTSLGLPARSSHFSLATRSSPRHGQLARRSAPSPCSCRRLGVGLGNAVLALRLRETDVLGVSGKRRACLLGDFVLGVGVLDRLVIVRL